MEELLVYLKIIYKRWIPASIVFIAVAFVLGYLRARNTVPLYRSTGLIIFEVNSSTSTVNPFTLEGESRLSNEIVLFKSNSVLEKLINNLDTSSQFNLEQINDNLTITNPDGTDVISISFIHENPQVSAQVVNELINVYAELAKDESTSQARELSLFVEEQIPQSQAELARVAEELRTFKQENLVVDITAEAASTSRIISELDSKIAEVKAELSAQQSKLESLRAIFPVDAKTALNSSFINDSSVASSFISKIQETKIEIEQRKIQLGDRHPEIITLQQQLNVLEEQLKDYTRNTSVTRESFEGNLNDFYQPGSNQSDLLTQYASIEMEVQSLESKLNSLNDLIATYRQRVNVIPDLEFEQQQIDRELNVTGELLNNLIKTYQDTQLAINNTTSRIRTIEYARIPENPAINRSITYLIQGILGAIILASLVAYLLEQIDSKIIDVNQVKAHFKEPILGKISKFDNVQELQPLFVLKNDELSPISDNFKSTVLKLGFIGSEQDFVKVITISSSVPDEGKSSISANLAIAAASLGKKILLVEADLRNPSQRGLWEISEQKNGLNQLLEKDSKIIYSDVIHSLGENLDLLLAGKGNLDPLTLIASPEMHSLTGQLKEEYDLIIFDAPPLTVATDAQILSRMSDGMVFVIRHGKTAQSVLENIKETITHANVNVLGLVLNCFPADKSDNYYYNYYGNKK